MPRRLRMSIDKTLCIGSGMCTGIAPETFELDDQGTARLIAHEIDGTDPGAVLDAEACCPVQAITVSDDAEGSS